MSIASGAIVLAEPNRASVTAFGPSGRLLSGVLAQVTCTAVVPVGHAVQRSRAILGHQGQYCGNGFGERPCPADGQDLYCLRSECPHPRSDHRSGSPPLAARRLTSHREGDQAKNRESVSLFATAWRIQV
jgi:hypothetical protein